MLKLRAHLYLVQAVNARQLHIATVTAEHVCCHLGELNSAVVSTTGLYKRNDKYNTHSEWQQQQQHVITKVTLRRCNMKTQTQGTSDKIKPTQYGLLVIQP